MEYKNGYWSGTWRIRANRRIYRNQRNICGRVPFMDSNDGRCQRKKLECHHIGLLVSIVFDEFDFILTAMAILFQGFLHAAFAAFVRFIGSQAPSRHFPHTIMHMYGGTGGGTEINKGQ